MDFSVDPKRAEFIGVEYQRNGVGGAGFYTVDFKYDGERLVGIIPSDRDYAEHIAVIMPEDLTRHFRGADYFGPWLIEQTNKHPYGGVE